MSLRELSATTLAVVAQLGGAFPDRGRVSAGQLARAVERDEATLLPSTGLDIGVVKQALVAELLANPGLLVRSAAGVEFHPVTDESRDEVVARDAGFGVVEVEADHVFVWTDGDAADLYDFDSADPDWRWSSTERGAWRQCVEDNGLPDGRFSQHSAIAWSTAFPVAQSGAGRPAQEEATGEKLNAPRVCTVVLASVGNPDRDQDPSRPLPGVPLAEVSATSLADASRRVREYIAAEGLGGGNWNGGQVRDRDGALLATVSYNGRVWLEGAERLAAPSGDDSPSP